MDKMKYSRRPASLALAAMEVLHNNYGLWDLYKFPHLELIPFVGSFYDRNITFYLTSDEQPLEFTSKWFLYCDNMSQLSAHQVRHSDYHGCIEMSISIHWYESLYDSGFFNKIDNKTFQQRQLMLSGDVETNPGPTQSKIQQTVEKRYSNKLRAFELQRQKQQTKIKNNRKDHKQFTRFFTQGLKDQILDNMAIGARVGMTSLVKGADGVAGLSPLVRTAAYTGINAMVPGMGVAAASVIEGRNCLSTLDNILPTTQEVKNMVTRLREDLPSITASYAALPELVASTLQTIKQTWLNFEQQGFSDIFTRLTSTITKVNSAMTMLQLGITILMIYLAFHFKDVFLVSTTIVLTLYFFDWDVKLVNLIKSFLVRNEFVTQSYSEPLHLLGKILFSVLSFYITAAIPHEKFYETIINRLDKIPKAANGAFSIFEKSGEIFEMVWKEVQVNVLGVNREDLCTLSQQAKEIAEWTKRIEYYLSCKERLDLSKNPESVAEIELLYKTMLRWKHTTAIWKSLPTDCQRIIVSMVPIVSDLYKVATRSTVHEGGSRVAPLCVFLSGESGVGKSELIRPLATELLRARGYDGQVELEMYCRNTETDYWDGYSGQKIVVMDDAFQLKDVLSKPCPELMEIVRLNNTAPCQVHCADLNDKGRFFSSEVLLITSNLEEGFARFIQSVHSPEAVIRRLNTTAYRVSNNDEYMTHAERNGKPTLRLDKVKIMNCSKCKDQLARIPEELKTDMMKRGKMPWCGHIYSFQKYDMFTDEEIGQPMGYAEFIQAVTEQDSAFAERERDKVDFYKVYDNFRFFTQGMEDDDPWYFDSYADHFPTLGRIYSDIPVPINELSNPRIEDLIAMSDRNHFQTESQTNEYSLELHEELAAYNLWFSHVVNIYMKEKDITPEFYDQQLAEYPELFELYQNTTASQARIEKYELTDFSITVFSELSPRGQVYEFAFKFPNKKTLFQRIKDWTMTISEHIKTYFATLNLDVIYSACKTALTILCISAGLFKIYEWTTSTTKNSNSGGNIIPTDGLHIVDYCHLCDENNEMCDAKYKDPKYFGIGVCYNCTEESESPSCKHCYSKFINKYGICSNCSENLRTETASSGDPKITTRQKVKTENSSGDPKLTTRNVIRTENSSGDPKLTTRHTIRTEDSFSTEHGTSSGEPYLRTKHTLRTENKNDIIPAPTEFQTEGVSDVEAFQICNRVLSNMYAFQVHSTHHVVRGNVIFLKGTSFLMPYHFYTNIEQHSPKTTIHLSNFTGPNVITFTLQDLKNGMIRLRKNEEESDACVVYLDPKKSKVMYHKDVTKYFMPAHAVQNYTGRYKGNLATYHEFSKDLQFIPSTKSCDGITGAFDQLREVEVAGSLTPQSFFVRYKWEYTSTAVAGDCGAPLIISNNSFPHKLLGIHVAGNSSSVGLAVLITREMLQNAFLQIPLNFQAAPDLDNLISQPLNILNAPEKIGSVPVKEGLNVIGQVDSSRRVTSGGKTKIIPSPLFDTYAPHTTLPTCLNKNSMNVDPMELGLRKFGKIPPRIPFWKIELAQQSVSNKLNTNIIQLERHRYARILTYEEAVLGVDGDDYMIPINRATSMGYPYTLDRTGISGKRAAFGMDEWTLDSLLAQRVRQDVNDLLEKARQGIQCDVIWTDTLKDERRPIAKVQAGKTRVFCGGPVHFTILFRQYFLGFASWVMHNKNRNEISTGTNVYNQDWDDIAQKLMTKGKGNIVAGDFENFDGSLSSQVLWTILDLINTWYDDGEENQQIRHTLWLNIVHAVHINDDVIYQTTHSQPSGCPITAILNSMYNSLITRIVFLGCAQTAEKEQGLTKGTLANMGTFDSLVSMVSYGDDNLIAIHSSIISWFNQLTITAHFDEIGHKYTDECKTGHIYEVRNLSDVAYLKRKFVFDEMAQRYIAPLDLDVILEIPQWTKRGAHEESILLSNIDVTLRELSLHGQDTFSKYFNQIRQKCVELDIPYVFRTFSEYKTDVLQIPFECESETDLDIMTTDRYIVHAIGADATFGAGFAKQLANQRCTKKTLAYLRSRKHRIGYSYFDIEKRVIHMITKEKSNRPPITTENLAYALRKLNAECVRRGISELAMPAIGCGLDARITGLNVEGLRIMVKEFLPNIDVKIFL